MGSMYLTDKEKEIILDLYNKGYSTVMIADQIGRNNCTIGRFLKRNGLSVKNYKNGILEDEIIDIIQLYQSGKSAKEIWKKYSNKIKCEKTIINILKRNGIEIRPRGVPTYFNKRYFETIDTEAKAYFLGLFLTDGNVHKIKRNTEQYSIQISLKYEDVSIIEKFKSELNANNKIIHYNNNDRDECIFSVHSKEMAHDLFKYGIHERKTFDAKLTNLVPENLYHHYIRGIFDGDGTVYMRNDKSHQLLFGFYGTHILVSQVKEYLLNKINVSNNVITDKETVSFITFSKKTDILNFYNLIYSDANFYLDRKKNKFEEYFKIKNII